MRRKKNRDSTAVRGSEECTRALGKERRHCRSVGRKGAENPCPVVCRASTSSSKPAAVQFGISAKRPGNTVVYDLGRFLFLFFFSFYN